MPKYVGKPPEKTPKGKYSYTFIGWIPEIVPVTQNAVYIASYNKTINRFTVIFDKNALDAEGTMDPVTVNYGESLTLPVNSFSREGYFFSRWNSAKDGTGTDYGDGQIINNMKGNLTLFAIWINAKPKSLNDSSIRLILDPEIYQYNGTEKTVRYKVYDESADYWLEEGVDYVLDEDNSTVTAADPGSYIVVVTADYKTDEDNITNTVSRRNYYGSRSATWHIIKSEIPDFPIFDPECLMPSTGFSQMNC